MPNSTCRLLSNGYKFEYLDNVLRLRPCCHYSEHVAVKDNNDAEILEYRERINNLEPYTDPGCQRCAYHEKNNLRKTWRQFSFDIVPDDAEYNEAYYLEIQLDNICNGGCIMCSPRHSSFWTNELIKNNIPVVVQKSKDHVNRILELIDIQKPRKILFLGGEPFLSDVDLRLLPLINHPENVNLQYTTNGSIFPSAEQINIWKNFKSVLINFSIDGIVDRFEYIRYPLKWQVVCNNMFKMRELLPDNVQFKINHTVNILSLYYWEEFDSWQQKNFSHDKLGRSIPVTFNPSSDPLPPYVVPEKLHSLLVEKYGQDSLPVRTIKNKSEKMGNILRYLADLDRRRNQSWKTVFPEISDCFK